MQARPGRGRAWAVLACAPAPGVRRPPVAVPVPMRVGKKTRLMIEVFDPVTGAEVEALVCPFLVPAYRSISVTPLGPALLLLSARKGKPKVTLLLPV